MPAPVPTDGFPKLDLKTPVQDIAESGSGIDALTRLAAGNPHLVTNPNLLQALATGNATPAQAAAVNSFMAGMKLQTTVEGARQIGQPVTLTDDERSILDNMHVQYQDVVQTPQQALDALNQQASAQNMQVAVDQNGQALFNQDGSPVLVPKNHPQASKKKGGFWHDVNKALSAAAKPFQVVSSNMATQVHNLFEGKPTPAGSAENVTATATSNMAEDMSAAGYDPNNPFSILAYQGAGKQYFDTTPISNAWDQAHPQGQNGMDGAAVVNMAKQFVEDPGKITTGIEQDTSLSPEEKAQQLTFLSSKDFQAVTQEVQASKASIGNALIGGIGVDPVKHHSLYTYSSAGVDLASAFALDPVLLTGKLAEGVKVAQVGLRGFQDGAFGDRVKDILLTPSKLGVGARANVQRGMQRFIDNANAIREAGETGDAAKAAAAYADIRATTPALEPLLGDFTGGNRLLVDGEGNVSRGADGAPIVGKGDPITNMQEAADYLSSKAAFGRLMTGRAAVEWNLMPGALSAFGWRTLVKAPLAGRVGARAAVNLNNYQTAMKVLPWIDNAVDESGHVIAARGRIQDAQAALDAATASGKGVAEAQNELNAAQAALPSAQRAAREDVQNSGRLQGEVQANLLRRGTVTGEGFSLPGYVSAQAERTARRLSSFLPRNTEIALHDSSSADKVYKFLQLYMSRGDAALGAARWAAGDEGVRRSMVVGIQQQVMHAAGYGASEAGRAELDRVARLADNPVSAADDAVTHQYAVKGEDLFTDPRLGGQQVHYGVLPSHANTTWTLPSFGELSRNAAQSSLLSKLWGRSFNSRIADVLTYGFKMFQLMKPSTWVRNMVEGLGNAAFRGELGDALRAKAAATAAGQYPERGLSRFLNAKNWGPLRGKIKVAPLALVGRAYRHTALRAAGLEDGLKYIADLPTDDLVQFIQDYSTQHMRADLDPAGLLQRREILDQGFAPQQLHLDTQHGISPFRADKPAFERQGFAPQSADDLVGADRWAGNLATLVNEFPAHAKALMDVVRSGEGDISPVLKAIEADPSLQSRIAALRPSSLIERPDGRFVDAVSDEDKQAALEELVRRQVSVARGMLTDRQGNYIDAVDDYIRTNGKAPPASWLMDTVPNAERPAEVLAPKYVAVPKDQSEGGFARTLAAGLDKAYEALVERPIHLTTSMPVFLANYGKARYFLADEEEAIRQHILDVGGRELAAQKLSGDALEEKVKALHARAAVTADELAKRQAVKMSWTRTEQIIDDPGLKTQFDIVGRNFFMYSRATQAMIRRWGQAIVQDPVRLQKAALALHAAEHSGLIYRDKYGELNFVYPGSGPLISGISRLMGALPGFGSLGQLPITPDVTGKVLFAAPGLDNPLRMGASPLVNVPYRLVEKFVGNVSPQLGIEMDQADRFWNGPIGAGQIGTNFEPTALRNLFAAMNNDDKKGQLASAMRNATANLIAADPDGKLGIVPGPDASDAAKQQFLDRVRIQTRNNLFVRWALGLVAPAPPSAPTESTSGSGADAAFSVQGLKSLRDEYQQLLNNLSGDVEQANQVWAAMHPDKLLYEQSQTHGTAKGVTLPAGNDTLNWIKKNLPFMEKYKATAAYFIPQTNEQFSDQAYQEEMALGLREYYSTSDWYDQLRSVQSGDVFWKSWDSYSTLRDKLKASGDSSGASALTQRWSAWEKDFLEANPSFAAQLDASTSTNTNQARDVLSNLRDMLANPKGLPSSVPTDGLRKMVQSYDNYQQWTTDNSGVSSDVKSNVRQQYGQYMLQLGAQNPSLLSLYNGVFRKLTKNLPQVGG